MASSGNKATEIGKFILQTQRKLSPLALLFPFNFINYWRCQCRHLQFIPFDVVEETLVCSHFFRLDRLEEVPAVVCQGTHQVVFFKAGKQERQIREWHVEEKIAGIYRLQYTLTLLEMIKIVFIHNIAKKSSRALFSLFTIMENVNHIIANDYMHSYPVSYSATRHSQSKYRYFMYYRCQALQ